MPPLHITQARAPFRQPSFVTPAKLIGVPTRGGENALPKSVWNGRTGWVAFELSMTKEESDLQTIRVESGLVAFFDILGFRKMLSANEVEESLRIVNTCMLEGLAETERMHSSQLKIQTFVISDSILVVLPDLTVAGVSVFTSFCDLFLFGLLVDGLPARGAIAAGKFCIQTNSNQIILAGQPIIDAHELADSLEIAACALTSSAESKVLQHLTTGTFKIYDTPIKGGSTQLHLLKYTPELPREQMIRCFKKHNKHLDSKAIIKLNNTIEFMKKCGELKP
jgi:hypothetical protein